MEKISGPLLFLSYEKNPSTFSPWWASTSLTLKLIIGGGD
jgi:hypothetical protein